MSVYQVETDGGTYEVETHDAPPEKTVAGFANNLGHDALGLGESLMGTAKTLADPGNIMESAMAGSMQPTKDKLSQDFESLKQIPQGLLEEGKRLGGDELLTGNLGNAASKFGQAAYDKPLTTAMDVAPFIGGAKALTAGKAAGQAAKVAPEIEGVAKSAIPESGLGDLANKVKGAVPQDVKDYLNQKYGQATKIPGAVENFGKALEQKARGMRLKEIGGSPGQIRTLRDRFGEGVVNDLADLADKKGITKGFFNWQTGNEIAKLTEDSGKKIGAIRDIAKQRGAIHDPQGLVNQIKAELDPIYLKGTGSSQKGPYLKALQDIQNSATDASSLANTISEKNKFIKKNKMTQPLGATSDVMNLASRLNNDLIGKFLKPEESQLYKEALKDFSAAKVYNKMYGFTYGRDMAGRSGPASPINFIKDVGGRKVMEKVFDKVGKRMRNSPDIMDNPMSLSSDVLDAISDSLDEIMQQMGNEGSSK